MDQGESLDFVDDLKVSRLDKSKLEEKVKKTERMHKVLGVDSARELIKAKLIEKGLHPSEAEEVSRGKGVRIALINSGIDINHPEIKGRFPKGDEGINYVNWTYLPNGKRKRTPANPKHISSDDPHCLSVVGILAAEEFGILKRAGLYVVRVCDDKKHGEQQAVKKGLTHIKERKNDFDLVNMSIGLAKYEQLMTRKIYELCEELGQEIVLVAAAGNDKVGHSIPSSFPNVISVGASCCAKGDSGYNTACDFTNLWPTVDVAAPGQHILGLYTEGKDGNYDSSYGVISGTSAATPIVTGIIGMAVAYLKARNQLLANDHKPVDRVNPLELEEMLKHTACTKERRLFGFLHTEREIEMAFGKYFGFHKINPNLRVEDFKDYMLGAGRVDAEKFVEVLLEEYD